MLHINSNLIRILFRLLLLCFFSWNLKGERHCPFTFPRNNLLSLTLDYFFHHSNAIFIFPTISLLIILITYTLYIILIEPRMIYYLFFIINHVNRLHIHILCTIRIPYFERRAINQNTSSVLFFIPNTQTRRC